MSGEPVTAFAREPLDALVWRGVGRTAGVVEQILDTNPGLARIAAALPEGTVVTLPASPAAPAPADLVQLWD